MLFIKKFIILTNNVKLHNNEVGILGISESGEHQKRCTFAVFGAFLIKLIRSFPCSIEKKEFCSIAIPMQK